jgi:hypothetical protein
MPALTIHVAPDQRAGLLRELLSLYVAKADALHHAADSYLTSSRSLDQLLSNRSELASIGALIEQLGWQLNDPSRPGRLTGDSHLLAQVSRSALGNVIRELGDALSDAGGGAHEIEAIARGLSRATELFALLRTIYRPAP